MLRSTLSQSLHFLPFIGKNEDFRLSLDHDPGRPAMVRPKTVSTYVYKRAFNWNHFRSRLSVGNRGGVVWRCVRAAVVLLNRLLSSRERLEF